MLPPFTVRKNAHVVIGEADFIDRQAALWRCATSKLPSVRLEVLRGAVHNAWIDEPTQFGALVSAALAGASTQSELRD